MDRNSAVTLLLSHDLRQVAPFRSRRVAAVLLALGVFCIAGTAVSQTRVGVGGPKNVILMISDGTGANTIAATGMYTGKLGKEIYDGANWTKAWSSTYALRTSD